mgnify:CR=1 FL=1
MNYPLFERSEGFYFSIANRPDWVDNLARQLDMESLASASLDESERVILHFRQLGYTTREIARYYGTSQSGLNRKLKKIFSRLESAAVRSGFPGMPGQDAAQNIPLEDDSWERLTA